MLRGAPGAPCGRRDSASIPMCRLALANREPDSAPGERRPSGFSISARPSSSPKNRRASSSLPGGAVSWTWSIPVSATEAILAAQHSSPVYRQATMAGRSSGPLAWIDQARRMNCACVQASGVAERVPSPRGPGRSSAAAVPDLLGQHQAAVGGAAIVRRYGARRGRPAARTRRARRSGAAQARPNVWCHRPVEDVPLPPSRSRRSRRSVKRCQTDPLGVRTPSTWSPTVSELRITASSARLTPNRTRPRKLWSTTRRSSTGPTWLSPTRTSCRRSGSPSLVMRR